MKKITMIIKGTLVGLGGILPGVSGGMIAAAFNIYEDLILALNKVSKTPIKAILSIWEYLLGIAIGVLVGIIVIATVFKKFPLPITLLFIGLILGGIPDITKEVSREKKHWYHYLISIVMMVIMVGVMFIDGGKTVNLGYFQYVLAGFLIALSLIVPGLSGTMILLALGLYTHIMIDTINEFIKLAVSLNISGALQLALPIGIIGITGLLSLILLAKPLSYVLKNYKTSFNFAVLGILIISPINIIWSLYNEEDYSHAFESINAITIIVSIILFAIGLFIALKISKMGSNEGTEVNAIKE